LQYKGTKHGLQNVIETESCRHKPSLKVYFFCLNETVVCLILGMFAQRGKVYIKKLEENGPQAFYHKITQTPILRNDLVMIFNLFIGDQDIRLFRRSK
jgi:hypothetical protein